MTELQMEAASKWLKIVTGYVTPNLIKTYSMYK